MERYKSIYKEAKDDYVVRHKTYSGAIEEGLKRAYDLKYYIKEEEIFSNISSKAKPSEGKTNKMSLLLETFDKEESMTWEEANIKSLKKTNTRLPTVDELQAIHGSDQKNLYDFKSGLYACAEFKGGNTVDMSSGKYQRVPSDTNVKVKILKEVGKNLNMQIYNMGDDIENKYELNCYIS